LITDGHGPSDNISPSFHASPSSLCSRIPLIELLQ